MRNGRHEIGQRAGSVRLGRRVLLRHAAVLCGLVAAAGRDVFALQETRAKWFSSIVWAVLENHGYGQSVNLPSHRRLAQRGTVLTQYYAVGHPSGPNYRAMASGRTWGGDEEIRTFHPSVASEAARAGIPAYIYHLKGAIETAHNPLRDLRAPVAEEKHGMAAFRADLARGFPPRCLVYCGWDNENDAHDGSLETADRNVSELLDALETSRWFSTPDDDRRYPALFLTWDEDEGGRSIIKNWLFRRNNHVFAAWWGRGVRTGATSATHHTHYGFCRTMTENWYLPALGQAGLESPITEPFVA